MRRLGNRLLAMASIVSALVIGAVGAAEAKVPIPCTGEYLVKVLDIPKLDGLSIKANEGIRNKKLGLGYKFNGCFSGGEWIGYVGAGRTYLPLNPEQLETLLEAAGRSTPPPVPSITSSSDAMFPIGLWSVVIIVAIAWTMFKKSFSSGNPTEAQPGIDPAQAAVAQAIASSRAPVSRVAAPVARASAEALAPRRSASAMRPAGPGAPRGFGRRG